MAVETNGKLVESKGTHGITNALTSGSSTPPRKPVAKKAKSFGLFSSIARLFTWYALITILARCPSTVDQLTDSSPKICSPYFTLRSFAAPHLEPYYDTYAASYVDAARPYYDTLNKRVIIPATTFGRTYVAPRIAQAQGFGQAQWEKTVQPQVIRLRGIANEQYDVYLARHVDAITKTTGPYFEIATTNAFQTYYGHILPTYNIIQPYAIQGYGIASDFTVNTALPYSKWAWTTTTVFLDRTVWPRLRILYGENVEPQLVRIGERLGRYRDGKKLKASVEEINISSSTSSASSTSETLSSIESSISSEHATTSSSSITPSSNVESSVVPESTTLSEKEIRENAQIIVTNDLKTWQEKFAKAADEGSDELEARINDITEKAIHSQAEGVGRALIIELEETLTSSFKTLKSKIQSIVKNAKEGDDSEEALNLAVRKAGAAIKGKAQAVRTWRRTNDDETSSLIGRAAEDTFDIIDHIRDLGLQEIGMRWAWTDGITHKDWAKYHQLKTKFDEWRVDVEKVATEHPGLPKARAASEDVENHAMAIAGEAAKELSRLKETGRWKLSTGDASDDFSTKFMPAAAAVAEQKVLKKVNDASEAIVGTAEGSSEPAVSVASSVIASQVDNVQNAGHSVTQSAESIVSSLFSDTVGTSEGSVESVASAVKEAASIIVEKASSAIIGTSQGTIESIASVGSASASSLSSTASLSDTVSSLISSASSLTSSVSSEVASSLSTSETDTSSSISSTSSAASSTETKKVWGGAVAEHVEARKIIFEDAIDDSDSQVAAALSSVSAIASSRLSEGLALATKRLESGVDYVKAADIGGPQRQRLNQQLKIQFYAGIGMAHDQYNQLLDAASSAIFPRPTPISEYENSIATATMHLANALSTASSKLNAALSSLSSYAEHTDAPVTENLAVTASSQFSKAISLASASFQSVQSVIAEKQAEVASAASENWEALVTKASDRIYGTQTPYAITRTLIQEIKDFAPQATEAALSRYSQMQSLIGELVSDKVPAFTESVYKRFSAAYPTAAFASAPPQASAPPSDEANEAARKASEGAGELASDVSSAIDAAKSHIKDEL